MVSLSAEFFENRQRELERLEPILKKESEKIQGMVPKVLALAGVVGAIIMIVGIVLLVKGMNQLPHDAKGFGSGLARAGAWTIVGAPAAFFATSGPGIIYFAIKQANHEVDPRYRQLQGLREIMLISKPEIREGLNQFLEKNRYTVMPDNIPALCRDYSQWHELEQERQTLETEKQIAQATYDAHRQAENTEFDSELIAAGQAGLRATQRMEGLSERQADLMRSIQKTCEEIAPFETNGDAVLDSESA